MKKSLLLALAICLASVTGFAAEPVQSDISNSNLSAIGLAGMTVVSDDEGSQVRGKGFSFTGGNGFAFGIFPPAGFSTNNYLSGGLFSSGGSNSSRAGFGLGAGFGIAPFFGFGGGFGAGQFGGGNSGSFGF